MKPNNEFKQYVSKLRYVEAVEVDSTWQEFLNKEQGYTSVNIGDFYVKQCDGSFIVLTKERFHRLFEEESTVSSVVLKDLGDSINIPGDLFEKDK